MFYHICLEQIPTMELHTKSSIIVLNKVSGYKTFCRENGINMGCIKIPKILIIS